MSTKDTSTVFDDLDDMLGRAAGVEGAIEMAFSCDELADYVACSHICEGRVPKLLRHNGAFYAVTGAHYWNSTAEFFLQKCIPLSERRSADPKPRSYQEKVQLIERASRGNEKRRSRLRANFYSGMRFTHKGTAWVFLREKLTARPQERTPQPEQLSLSFF